MMDYGFLMIVCSIKEGECQGLMIFRAHYVINDTRFKVGGKHIDMSFNMKRGKYPCVRGMCYIKR